MSPSCSSDDHPAACVPDEGGHQHALSEAQPAAPPRQPLSNAANAPSRAKRSLSVDAPVLGAPVSAVVGTAARAPPRTTLSTEPQSGAEKGCDPKAIAMRSSLVGSSGVISWVIGGNQWGHLG